MVSEHKNIHIEGVKFQAGYDTVNMYTYVTTLISPVLKWFLRICIECKTLLNKFYKAC